MHICRRTSETALYRIFQEALTNVASHAQASTVRLLLRRSGASVIAAIKDNGRGFDVNQIFKGNLMKQGAGLLGMRERVALLGGRFNVTSEAGLGTQISIEIPLENIL